MSLLTFKQGRHTLQAEFTYLPATPDVHYLPNGDPGYPGDPEEVEPVRMWVKRGDRVRLIADDTDMWDILFDNDEHFQMMLDIGREDYKENCLPEEP